MTASKVHSYLVAPSSYDVKLMCVLACELTPRRDKEPARSGSPSRFGELACTVRSSLSSTFAEPGCGTHCSFLSLHLVGSPMGKKPRGTALSYQGVQDVEPIARESEG